MLAGNAGAMVRKQTAKMWVDIPPEQFKRTQQEQNRAVNQKRMWKLKQQSCADCELKWHPHCMTFDHIDRTGMKLKASGKPVPINQVSYWNPVAFNKQLKLMDVVCRNCHMIREAKRDIDNPMVKPNMKQLFPIWFEKCKGGLFIEQPKSSSYINE